MMTLRTFDERIADGAGQEDRLMQHLGEEP